MNFKRHAMILAVIDNLRRHGSWTGKTHVQKALALLRDLEQVEVPFEFVLYKHGPYSFDVEAELEQMQSYGAIAVEPNAQGYGVTLSRSEGADLAEKAAPLSEGEVQAVQHVCAFIGRRHVTELERLATASWIRCQEHLSTAAEVASRLHALKPHVSTVAAESADAEIRKWFLEVGRR